MNFLESLNENLRKSELSKDSLNDLLKTDYSEAYENYKQGHIIWRGVKESMSPITLYKPSETLRKSAHTYNYYTLIIDNSDEWVEYPKRSRSIICSSNERTILNFGDPYIVLPKNNSKLGICPERDMWFSFNTLPIDLEQVSEALKEISDKTKISLNDNSYQEFSKGLRSIDKVIKGQTLKEFSKGLKSTSKAFIEALAEEGYKGDNMELYLEDLLSPENNNFELIKVKDYSLTSADNKEIWTDGDCILITKEELESHFGEDSNLRIP